MAILWKLLRWGAKFSSVYAPQGGPNSSVDENLICDHESSLVQQYSFSVHFLFFSLLANWIQNYIFLEFRSGRSREWKDYDGIAWTQEPYCPIMALDEHYSKKKSLSGEIDKGNWTTAHNVHVICIKWLYLYSTQFMALLNNDFLNNNILKIYTLQCDPEASNNFEFYWNNNLTWIIISAQALDGLLTLYFCLRKLKNIGNFV